MVRAFLNSQSCRRKLTNPQARVIITQNIIERKNQSIGFLLRLIIRGGILMEFRRDLVYSVPKYGGKESSGLLTLGEFKVIQLDNGKNIELLPYLIQTGYTRGTSKQDPRVRRSNYVAIPQLAAAYADHFNNAGLGEHWTTEEVEEMLKWQLEQSLGRYFFVKWARDLESNKEFPIGFFCAYTKPFQSGQMIWDG